MGREVHLGIGMVPDVSWTPENCVLGGTHISTFLLCRDGPLHPLKLKDVDMEEKGRRPVTLNGNCPEGPRETDSEEGEGGRWTKHEAETPG